MEAHTELVLPDQLQRLQKQIFDSLDVAENTRLDYSVRIKHFLQFTQREGLNRNTYLAYKRFLSSSDTYSISTKNKYLISAKVFLDGLYRMQIIPLKITDNIKGFTQSRLHKKDGLSDEAIFKIQGYCSELDSSLSSLRLKAILSLLIFQGLRQIEIIRLNVGDVDLITKTALILGKGMED